MKERFDLPRAASYALFMSQRPGRLVGLLLACVALAGCPKSPPVEVADPPSDDSGNEPLPPAVPAEVETEIQEPREGHDPSARSPILDVMVEENKRWSEALAEQAKPAYYVAYEIVEVRRAVIEAEGGGLVTDQDQTSRALDVEVRVGSPKLDNTHPLRDDQTAAFVNAARLGKVPFGTDPKAIRHHLWLETDRRYRAAKDVYAAVLHEQRVSSSEPSAPDFVHEKGEVFIQPEKELELDKEHWIERLRGCSEKAARGVATRARCQAIFERTTTWYVNSDGAELQMSDTNARLAVSVGVKADDGMPLSRLEQRFAPTPAALPDDDQLAGMIDKVTDDLEGLHEAPVVDPYVGPAILEGRAAAVFFHEVFGHRVEGHRQKRETSGQTFTDKVGKQIMPAWLSVYDDPRVTRLNGHPLNGFYRYDDEGVRAQRAALVEGGTLEGFLQGRQPIDGHPRSNGHGRKQPGHLPIVSRQGNLVVETKRSVTEEELLQQLIGEIKRQDKPYGMVFTDISGGFTNTSRVLPQSFKVQPVMAYRVYPDGRKELVRGVDIVGLPLTALASIKSAARPMETFNGMCGAESGWVPVSASAPSLLLEELEVERGFKPDNKSPVLAPPSVAQGGSR